MSRKKPSVKERQRVALHTAWKSVSSPEGKPKVGIEEFMSLSERWGFSKKTLKKIREALKEEDWGEGPFLVNYYSDVEESKVREYERTAREIFGTKYALGLSSGTAALHCAFVACGIGPGDEVICPAVGYVATASSVILAGGTPVLCDVDETLTLDPNRIEELITDRTVAIAPTPVMGNLCDMDSILKIARKRHLRVIEDAAQSCGATYHGKWAGTLGDIGCFSIAAYKIIGGGEGGLLLTNDKGLYERAQQFSEGGGLWRENRFGKAVHEGELFCGTNYRMSELEAALNVVQLRKMPGIVERFRKVRDRVLKHLGDFEGIRLQPSHDYEGEMGYAIRFYPETFDLGEKIVPDLQALGVRCGWIGREEWPDWHLASDMIEVLKRRDPQRFSGLHPERARTGTPRADDYYRRIVTVHLNQWMKAKDCKELANQMNTVFSKYSGRHRDRGKKPTVR
ncbi:MAG: DegT/DnrJ/EryC1/StrS family aminotransferase [Candidatus Omnitrophica bacterium]|nr:DegT/DnrJ/EryC1/StrS family aminotransferase [Candidatus Omnitrophota bacterium]